jgi:hypothetical protein
MDDRTCKHLVNRSRTCTQRVAANIPIGKIEHLLSCVLLLPSTTGEKEKMDVFWGIQFLLDYLNYIAIRLIEHMIVVCLIVIS